MRLAKISNTLILGLLSINLLNVGCGSKFSAQSPTDAALKGSVIGGGNPGDPGVIPTPVGDVNVPGVINDPNGALNDLTKVPMKLNLPYALLGKPFEVILNDALNQYVRTKDCDKVGTAADNRPLNRQYRCGEIPFGDIVSDSKKVIYKVEIPSSWGVQDGTNFWIGSGNTQMHASRYQRPGSLAIELLDSKTGTQLVPTTTELGKDIFLKLVPKNGILEAAACFTIPGTDITSGPLWIPGNINKSMLWGILEMNADLSINVDLGKVTFDSVKSCIAIQATYNKNNGLPSIKVIGIEQPQFQNLKLDGFKVYTDTNVHGFMGFVISIVDFFGAGIRSMIAHSVNQEVVNQYNQQVAITSAQVTSGEWILTVLQHEYLKPLLVDNINTALNKTQVTDGQKFEIEVGKWLGAACLTVVDRFAANQTALTLNQLYTVCKGIPDIQLNAFLTDTDREAEGCYSRFFSVNTLITNPGVWWAGQCHIKNEIIVTSPKAMLPFVQCVADAVNSNFQSVDSCKPYIDQLITLIKNGDLDSYFKNSSIVDAYMSDHETIINEVEKFARQYLGYSGSFVIDPSLLSNLAQIAGIVPSITLDTITSTGSKNLTVMNVDVANSKNLLDALIARKNAGTAPDIIMLQNANTDAARKFIKDINYAFVTMGPTKTGYIKDAGIAILSKYNITQSTNFSYGQNCLGGACDSNQGIIHARIKIDGVPHPIDVINTQFQSKQAAIAANLMNLLDYTQNKQLLDFATYVGKNLLTDIPMVIGGDFESDVNSRIYEQIMYALKVRNGGKECADVSTCTVLSGSQRYELWFNSFDHQFVKNSGKIAIKVLKGQRAFKTTELDNLISSGGALEMTYQINWKP